MLFYVFAKGRTWCVSRKGLLVGLLLRFDGEVKVGFRTAFLLPFFTVNFGELRVAFVRELRSCPLRWEGGVFQDCAQTVRSNFTSLRLIAYWGVGGDFDEEATGALRSFFRIELD